MAGKTGQHQGQQKNENVHRRGSPPPGSNWWSVRRRRTASPTPARRRTRRRSALLAGVERVDVGLEVLHDDVALHLQRRRHVPAVNGPVITEDPERLDRLSLGHRLVGVVDRGLYGSTQVVVVDEI